MPENWGIDDNRGRIPRQRVCCPDSSYGCWVEVRIHTGSMMSKYSGCFAHCTKERRKGKLTCFWHDKYEAEARRTRRIKEAAIKTDVKIWKGKSHASIIADIVAATGVKPVTGEQGFMTEDGNFVSRTEAAEIALASGQVKSLRTTELFSEDLHRSAKQA